MKQTLGQPRDLKVDGAYAAAFLSAAYGLLVLALVQLWTFLSKPAQEAVFDVGRAWVPGAEGIGPYSGKETFLLIGWLGSWIVLHLALRHRQVGLRLAFGIFLAVVALATILMWPPMWHLIKGE